MNRRLGSSTHAFLRMAAGVLFAEHGAQKLFGAFGGVDGGTVPLASLMGVAGVLELVGGTLLIAGLMTRPVAALLIAEMTAAYVMVHLPQGGWPIQNQGELALLYASVFVFLVGNGAGPLSLDALLLVRRKGERRHVDDRRTPVAA